MNNMRFNIKPKLLVDEVSDSTTEALFPLAKTVDISNFGNIFIKIREFGLFFSHADSYQNRLIGRFCEYYDGIVTSKLTKTEDTDRNIDGIAINALMYTDYAAFAKEIKSKFNLLMQTGFARRCMLSFNKKVKSQCKLFSKQEKQIYNNKLDVCGEKLFKIFKDVQLKSCYEITGEAYEELNNYLSQLTDLMNETDEAIIQKELKSRHLKAIKLSGLYAILNHPLEHIINVTDVKQAVISVEFMSADFKKFLDYKPPKKDEYEHIFQWFKDREGQIFKKTELTKIYYKDFGYSRLNFSKSFDEIMTGVKELAEVNEYVFNINKIHPNGMEYSLIKPKEQPLSKFVKPLDEILSDDIQTNDSNNSPF